MKEVLGWGGGEEEVEGVDLVSGRCKNVPTSEKTPKPL